MNVHDENYKTMTAHGTEQYAVPARRRITVPNDRYERREPTLGTPRPQENKDNRSGHDQVIKSLMAQRVTIQVVMSSGQSHTGIVRGRDAFTITLDTGDCNRLLYKHAIDEIVLPPHPGKGASDTPQ